MVQYESNHRIQLSAAGKGNTDLDSRDGVGIDSVLVGVGHRRHVPVLGEW